MEKPELYVKNSFAAQVDADRVLNKNRELLQSNDNCVVLDIGCGPGNITYEKILPLLPTTTKKLIGVDLSSDNIEYAKKTYKMDTRVSYKQLDILTDTIPTEWIGAFDLIVSLYCFHFVGDHRKALTNIYKMLKPGGKVLISFINKSVIPNLYKYVYNNPKWTKYMSNFNDVIFIQKSNESTTELFKEVGFSKIQYEEHENNFIYTKDCAFGIIKSFNYFNVPKNLEKDFIENQLEYFEYNEYVSIDDNREKQYHWPYTLAIITANKD